MPNLTEQQIKEFFDDVKFSLIQFGFSSDENIYNMMFTHVNVIMEEMQEFSKKNVNSDNGKKPFVQKACLRIVVHAAQVEHSNKLRANFISS